MSRVGGRGVLALLAAHAAAGQLQVGGVLPGLSVEADPQAMLSECGVGALMPWADRLWMTSYLATPGSGAGSGLYEVYGNLTMSKRYTHNSTHANRMYHYGTHQIVIGPYVIDTHNNIRVIEKLVHVRLTATAMHITDPANKVYMLTMEGMLYEVDLRPSSNLTAVFLGDLVKALRIPSGSQPHFKGMYMGGKTLYVTSNSFVENDETGKVAAGRLGGWKGGASDPWEVIVAHPFLDIAGRDNFGGMIYANGWDNKSAILMQKDNGDSIDRSFNTTWRRYRLPKASHAFDHMWQTEWPRIREVETERFMMDIAGQFYELSPLGWRGSTWGVKPVSQHVRVVPDYASFKGMFVLAGNEVSPQGKSNPYTGQSQSGLWFGKTDDLWSFGKPAGWGSVWLREPVAANTPSDPYLMTGFDHKVVHLTVHSTAAPSVTFRIEVDPEGFAGSSEDFPWAVYASLTVTPKTSTYAFHAFPEGFSAHWVRVVADAPCVASATFHYS